MTTYKMILEWDSTKSILVHRKFLNAKILCTNGRTKENYIGCRNDVDSALIQVFDVCYKDSPEDDRIGDLVEFLDEIDRQS